jgi:glycosyltransferase involved in cell wall biosynthesis
MVDLLLRWLVQEPAGSLVLKLHPGDGHWTEVRAAATASAGSERVTIVHREPLYPLLVWADLVLLHQSTVAVEALAAGTPVAIVASGDAPKADALPDGLIFPTVADPESISALARTIGDATTREAFIAQRRSAISETIGPLDGRSAERIAAYLLAS